MSRASKQSYLIALGSNMRHHRHGPPRRVLHAALAKLARMGLEIAAVSPVFATPPVGPSRRTFANGAAIVHSDLDPEELLDVLEETQASFGRRRGQRWGARVLDLDIVLWSGGAWGSERLTIPHAAMRERDFVLRPAIAIAANWRDPLTNLTLRHLHARLTKPRPAPR
jgi:2-amino-4-hydroxy-6-hydroxymethyldihydropteridine diphosphokinase